MSMDKYVRKQIIESNLMLNLKDLYKQKEELLNSLIMLEKMINKHETFLDRLEEDDND